MFLTFSLFGCGENSSTLLTATDNNSEVEDDETPTPDPSFGFTSINPTNGPEVGGTIVTITGSLFTENTTVQFGASLCTNINLVSSTQLTCSTPAASEGASSVTIADGAESETIANAYTYGSPAPTFQSITPNNYINSQSVNVFINGSGFESGITVTIGGAPCTSVSVNSGSELTCNSPIGVAAGAQDIVITGPTANSVTEVSGFTYRVAPTLTILKGSTAQGALQACGPCHTSNSSGGFNINNFASYNLVAGDPEDSILWQRMAGTAGSIMPPSGARPNTEIDALYDWILDGAQDN